MKSYSVLEGEMNKEKEMREGICFHMTKKKESMSQWGRDLQEYCSRWQKL